MFGVFSNRQLKGFNIKGILDFFKESSLIIYL